jgi:hypothetical protein
MNLLSLVSPWLDKFCQITTKNATRTFPQKISHLNTPWPPLNFSPSSNVDRSVDNLQGSSMFSLSKDPNPSLLVVLAWIFFMISSASMTDWLSCWRWMYEAAWQLCRPRRCGAGRCHEGRHGMGISLQSRRVGSRGHEGRHLDSHVFHPQALVGHHIESVKIYMEH